ncbi:methionine synthase [Corynebacterium sp. S7]
MTAFGLGELPGTSLSQAADIVISESPLPHVPQLPDRGLGSDLIGRTASLLPIHVDRGARSWRVTPRPQILTKRSSDQMQRDLDFLEEAWAGRTDKIKVQLAGPWTLAADIEMPNGHRIITDPGALKDMTEALLETARSHIADVASRFDAEVTLQLDEPRLPEIIAGQLKGTTDYETIKAVHQSDILERLEPFGEHLLNTSAPIFGAQWVTVDLTTLNTPKLLDDAGAALGEGHRFAIAPMEPKRVGDIVDKLRIDPATTNMDVYAPPAATLKEAAANYAQAREYDEILQRDFLS